jgi:hypothetical protein
MGVMYYRDAAGNYHPVNKGPKGDKGDKGDPGLTGPLDILTDVTAPPSTPAGKFLGTVAQGLWGVVDGLTQALADSLYLKKVADKAEPTILFTDPTNNRLAELEILDDSSTTTNWPDRFGFRYHNGTTSVRTGGFNEYGEGRFDAAKTSTVPLRAHGNGLSTHSANLFECRVSRAGATVFSVSATGVVTASAPTASNHLTTKAYVDGRIWKGTQAGYNAIAVKDPDVLYVITG